MNRKIVLGAAKYLISGSLVALLYLKIPIKPVLENVSKLHPGWFLLAVAANFLTLWLQAYRWKLLMPGTRVPVARLFQWCIIGAAAGSVLPSAVGGDALRAVLLGKEEGQLGSSIASTIFGRIMGLVAMLGICFLGVLSWPPLRRLFDATRLLELAAAGGLVGAGLVALALHRRRLPDLFSWKGRFERLVGYAMLVLKDPTRMLATVLLSLMLQALAIVAGWMLFRSCGETMPLSVAAALLPIVMLGTMAPVSIGGVGVREGLTTTLFFKFAGVQPAMSLAVNLMGYVIFVVVFLAGAACWFGMKPGNDTEKA
jgi:uncharacterized membrane protein YbhN (UPF0104 family)